MKPNLEEDKWPSLRCHKVVEERGRIVCAVADGMHCGDLVVACSDLFAAVATK